MVVQPLEHEPAIPYSLGSIYPGIVKNADGYTPELNGFTNQNVLLPYKICYEKSNNNRFEMGTGYQLFDVIFKRRPVLTFDLYLTMGYGASAKKGTKLNPTYYVPEFNRKSAWKVEVAPVTWVVSDPSTVTIDIFDWNHGATVATIWPDPAHTNYIRASSNVTSVQVEVPGMTNAVKAAATIDTTSNGWDDPLTYTATFINEKNLASGTYTGLVKVADSRPPGAAGASDSLMHTSDGYVITGYAIPEFATYQTFTATVILNNPPVWVSTIGIQSATPDYESITVTFGTATDPDGDNPVTYDLYYVDQTATGNINPFTAPNTVVLNIVSPFIVYGLTNYHTYWLGVRARDSKGLSETNTVKISALPEPVNSALLWAKRAGGSNTDSGYAITSLSDNSTVVTGYFSGSAIFGQGETNPIMLTSAGGPDIFIAKYSSSGTLIWAKRAGGTGDDFANAITTLSDGSLIVTGSFFGVATFGQDEPNETQLTWVGGTDFFIARYYPNGSLAWAKRVGLFGEDVGKAITTLSDDSIIVTGYFSQSVIFGQSEPIAIVLTSAGISDIFVTKYNPDGTIVWAKRAGGTSYDTAWGISKRPDDSTVVTGGCTGTVTFGPGEPGVTILTTDGTVDIFVANYNTNGTLVWAKRAGGSNNEYGYAVTSPSDNSAVVTGYFPGTATFGPGEANQTILTSGGGWDIFIAKYNFNGSLVWAKRAGGSLDQSGSGITTLSDNSSILTGFINGSTTFGPGESGQTILTSAGASDIFIAKYNTDGTLARVKRAGGIGADRGYGITALSDNSTVVTGAFNGSAIFGPGEPGETLLTSAGLEDIFIARFAH